MADDVALNKAAIIERCLVRVDEEYRGREDELSSNQTRQDSIILNLQRACEAAIYLAMHEVRTRRLGLPQGLCHRTIWIVIPANAGIHIPRHFHWIPAFAGMTLQINNL